MKFGPRIHSTWGVSSASTLPGCGGLGLVPGILIHVSKTLWIEDKRLAKFEPLKALGKHPRFEARNLNLGLIKTLAFRCFFALKVTGRTSHQEILVFIFVLFRSRNLGGSES